MLDLNDDRISIVVESLYKKGFFGRVSLFFFMADFNEKMRVASDLIRQYFQSDKLDDIVYDIVKSYCLRDDYSLDDVITLEDTDAIFYSFFEEYIRPFVKMARYVECGSKGRK